MTGRSSSHKLSPLIRFCPHTGLSSSTKLFPNAVNDPWLQTGRSSSLSYGITNLEFQSMHDRHVTGHDA